VEIHHTDDGKTVRIKFRAAPKRVHPNENKTFSALFGFGEFFNKEESENKEEPENKRFKGQVEGN